MVHSFFELVMWVIWCIYWYMYSGYHYACAFVSLFKRPFLWCIATKSYFSWTTCTYLSNFHKKQWHIADLSRYRVMGNQQGLIGWNLYAQKGCVVFSLKIVSLIKTLLVWVNVCLLDWVGDLVYNYKIQNCIVWYRLIK